MNVISIIDHIFPPSFSSSINPQVTFKEKIYNCLERKYVDNSFIIDQTEV